MQAPDLTHTLPPYDAVMSQSGQQVTLAIFGGMAVLLVVYGLYLAASRRSWLPVLFLLAAQIGLLLEGLGDVMGNAIYPPLGQINAFVIKGHPVPLFVVFVYIWYLGSLPLLMYDRFVKQSLSYSAWWKIALVSALGVTVVEQIPVYYGMWIYYGVQPFKIGLMPLWMCAANTVCVMFPALLVYRLMPILTGWRQLLVLPLVPAATAAGHAGAGIPMYNVLGGDTATMAPWILQLGSVATLVFSLALIWAALGIVYDRFPRGISVKAEGS